jgi:hypothetical protein
VLFSANDFEMVTKERFDTASAKLFVEQVRLNRYMARVPELFRPPVLERIEAMLEELDEGCNWHRHSGCKSVQARL